MNKIVLSFLALLCCINIQAGVKLQKQGTATQLVVNDKPMLLLAGELSNSAATSPADIRKALKQMKNSGVNSVFVPAYWEFIEPDEGKYDFALVDSIITTARKHDLKIVFLWFGAWKNSMSCYAPLWVKENTKRFPRSLTENGKPLEICTAFSDNLLQADKRAFCELMKHIKAIDSQENTVIMMQVENEIGMLESACDHSPLAEKAYRQPVPAPLLKTLKLKKKGTWAEVFGTDRYADEKFQAYYYAKYVEQLASAGKAIYKDNADTIVGNMDSQIFLGGSEPTTLKDLSEMLGKETIDAFNTSDTRGNSPSYGTTFQKMGHELLSRDELAVLDGGKCILQLRGVRPFLSDKYDLTQHPNYKLTSDYDPKNTFDIEKYLNRKEKINPNDEFVVIDADSLPSA